MNPTRDECVAAIRTLMSAIGEDPQREGLLETPDRVLRSYKELFAGYNQDPEAILRKSFTVGEYNQMILVKNIPFTSFCEHHWLPFTGMAHVAYIPEGKRVVGLSKIARVVDVFAKRLQIQERLTLQIGEVLTKVLMPKGVGVVIEATHQCMVCRGALKHGAKMVTSEMMGVFMNDVKTREEFLRLISLPV